MRILTLLIILKYIKELKYVQGGVHGALTGKLPYVHAIKWPTDKQVLPTVFLHEPAAMPDFLNLKTFCCLDKVDGVVAHFIPFQPASHRDIDTAPLKWYIKQSWKR